MQYACIKPSGYTLSTASSPNDEATRYGSYEYTSMSAFEANYLTDSSQTGGLTDNVTVEILHGDVSNNWNGSPDSTAFSWNGWDCSSATYKVTVKTLVGDEYLGATQSRPDYSSGAWDTSEYIFKITSGSVIGLYAMLIDNDWGSGDLNIEFIGIQFWIDTTVSQFRLGQAAADHSGISVEKCWFQQDTAQNCINFFNDSDETVNFKNNVVTTDGTGYRGIQVASAGTFNIIANSIFGFLYDGIFENSTPTIRVVNNISADNGDKDFDGTFTGTHNACDDSTSPGTDILPSGSDWDNEIGTAWTDIRPLNSGNIYQGGIDPNDGTWGGYLPSDDIIGTTRPTGDTGHTCGAFEYVAAGGVARALAGTIAAVSAFTGSPGDRSRIFTASLAAVSAFTAGPVLRSRPIAGALAAVSTFIASLSRLKELVGSFAAVSALTGTITRSRVLAGSFAAVSAFSAALTKVSEALKALVGTIAAVTSVSGAVPKRLRSIQGSFNSVSTFVAAPLKRLKNFIGSFAVVSAFAATLTKTAQAIKALAGTIALTASFVGGTLRRSRTVEGSSAAVSTFIAAPLKRLKELAGSFAAVSALTGRILGDGIKMLAGTIASVSSVSALVLKRSRVIQGVIDAISSLVGLFVRAIAPSSRTYIIENEDRTYLIANEDRTYTI